MTAAAKKKKPADLRSARWFAPDDLRAFRAFTIPERLQEAHGYPPLTAAAKDKILGLNAAAVYGVDLVAARDSRDAGREWLEAARRELGARLA